MESENLFKDENEAKMLLKESREKIDQLDNDLINLINERTALAKNIVMAKDYLSMDIYDKNREKLVQEKSKRLANELHIDEDIIAQIMELLVTLSKNEQKNIIKKT